MTDLSPWAAQAATISDDQAQQMRLVIAGHAENTADAKLLMQAFGLLPDPLCDRWEITISHKHRIKESARHEPEANH